MIWLLVVVGGILIFLGVPISIALGLAALSAVVLTNFSPVQLVVIQAVGSLNSFIIIAVPFFAMMGLLVCETKVAEKIFDFANDLTGWMKGGLGHVVVVASFIFGGMSGSGTADVVGLGRMQILEMVKRGFPLSFSVGLTGTASILATLVPPSINMVVYAVVVGQPVGACLISGFLPGALLAGTLMVYCWGKCKKENWGDVKPFRVKDLGRSFKISFPALLAPVVLLGGIFSGVFTPTEASLISIVYVFLISFIYKRLSFKEINIMLLRTTTMTGGILLVFCSASVVSFILASIGVPKALNDLVLGFTHDRIFILIIVNVILLIAGCFLDSISAMIILLPLLFPLVKAVGVHPLHFAPIVVANLGMGMLTPPVGTALFALTAVTRLPMNKVVRALIPYFIVYIVFLAIVTYVPWISLVLPLLLMSD